jgi:flagellar biosynthesis/type III secretory pathway protein FliH
METSNGWAFPDLNSIMDDANFSEKESRAPELDEKDKRLLELEACLTAKNQEIVQLTNELTKLNEAKSEEADRLIALTQSIHNIIPLIKTEIIHLVSDMVGKISHKVIQREVTTNQQLMMDLIHAYVLELGKAELIQIEVSPSDYEKMKQLPFDTKAKWQVNAELQPGDILVTSEIAGIRLVLNDLINRMVSEHHE